jgi:putative phosphonate catabolism associated alcohol dehydrogenase
MDTRCKIAIFESSGQPLKLEEVSVPALDSGELLVRIEYTTLCRSDLNTYCGKRNEKTPTILGHEAVGRISEFGPETVEADVGGKKLLVNDRITWAVYASDPQGKLAQSGIPQKAPDLFKYGHERITDRSNLHGGLAEYIILRKNTPILKLDDAIPLSVAAIINCSVATIAGAIRLAGKIEHKNVLISGAGMLGMMACAMCKVKNAQSIVAFDVNENRIRRSIEFGADRGLLIKDGQLIHHIGEFIENEKYDIVIELTGVAATVEQTLELLAIGGIAVWAGSTYPERDLHISTEKVVRNLWTVKGLHNYNDRDFQIAVEFIDTHHHRFPFETLVEKSFEFAEVDDAFKYALEANPFRVGINFQQKGSK